MTDARIVITGVPRSGKTTMVPNADLHTDDLIPMGWSEASQHIADRWLTRRGPWVIEGVAAVRGLRKWLRQNPHGSPCDVAVFLGQPFVAYTKDGQLRMARGCAKVWGEIVIELRRRGVYAIAVPNAHAYALRGLDLNPRGR